VLDSFPASLIEGRLLETILKAEGGVASCGGWLVTASFGRPGKPPARHYDLAARSSLYGSGGNAGEGSAAPRPKTATVERREASVPRYGTQGASLGAWRAALCARPTGVPPSTRTFLGAPPTPRFGGGEAKLQDPGARTRRGNEMGCLTS
jgi:hypothetical protein